MQGKCVVLGITGGIAAYKAAELVSLLKKQGCDVHVVMTRNAAEFITPLTLETLSANPVTCDTFRRERSWEVGHVALAKRADVLVIAPATANFIGKLALGIADDMLSTTAMATRAPIVLAPAMNTAMYQSAAVQQNLATLRARGCILVGPDSGLLACGDVGEGRMSQPEEIIDVVRAVLGQSDSLAGRHILVSAGPTREALDPVRYLTNRSSGRMGYAIAAEALARGARVTLVSGPVHIEPPMGAQVIAVQSTQEMFDAATRAFADCDAAVMAAAPADYRPARCSDRKIKKTGGHLALELAENPDIAAALGSAKRPGQVLVVFAAETDDLAQNAAAKLTKKRADLAVANDVTQPGAGFDVPTNIVRILGADGSDEQLPLMDKRAVAAAILDRVQALLESGAQ